MVELIADGDLATGRLSRRETEAMIRGVAPDDLPAAMVAQLVVKTDGVPLFIEELTKSVAESRSNFGFGEAHRDTCDLAGRASHPFGSSGADPANHSGGGAFGPGVRCRSSDRGEPAGRRRGQKGTARLDRG